MEDFFFRKNQYLKYGSFFRGRLYSNIQFVDIHTNKELCKGKKKNSKGRCRVLQDHKESFRN